PVRFRSRRRDARALLGLRRRDALRLLDLVLLTRLGLLDLLALVVLVLLRRLVVAHRHLADFERALAEDYLHAALHRRELHLERLRAHDGVVLHGARQANDVRVELARDLAFARELADPDFTVHRAGVAHRQGRRREIALHAPLHLDRAFGRERAFELRAFL